MSGQRRAALALAAACWAASVAAAEPFELEAVRHRFATTPQATIVARNDWGDLRVRTAARGGLVVAAMVQRIGTEEDELELVIEEVGDAVVVDVVPRVARPRGRVDLTLIVPAGKRFEGATRDGLVEVKYRGPVEVRTRRGSITVETEAVARAESESGDVTVRLARATDTVPLATVVAARGALELALPDAAGLSIQVATSGAIDFGFAAWPADRQGERRTVSLGADASRR